MSEQRRRYNAMYRGGEVGPNAGRPFAEQFGIPESENAVPFDERQERMRRMDATSKSALVRTPVDFPHIIQLARMATNAVIGDRQDADGNELNALERFVEGRYAKENRGKVSQYLDEHAQTFIDQNPEATEEDVNKYIEDITKSEAFHIFENEQLPSFFGALERAGDAIDMHFGAPRDHEKTNQELIGQAVSQVMVPGLGGVNAIGKANKFAKPLIEVLTPVNSAKTAPGYAAAVGFNAAVPALMTYGLDREVDFDEAKTPEEIKAEREEIAVALEETYEDDSSPATAPEYYDVRREQLQQVGTSFSDWGNEILVMLGAGVGAASGIRPSGRAAQSGPTSKITTTDDLPEPMAQSVANTVKGTVDDVGFAVREHSPIEESVRTAYDVGATRGWTTDDPIAARIAKEAFENVTQHSYGQATTQVRNAMEFGVLPGDIETIPIKRMADFRQALQDAGEYDEVMDFLHARTYMQRFRDSNLRPIEEELGQLNTQAQARWAMGDDNSYAQLSKQIAELESRKANLLADADVARWMRALENPPTNPKAREFIEAHDKINADMLRSIEADALMPKTEIEAIRQAHGGTYSPIRVDDLATKTASGEHSPRGMRRLAAKIRHNYLRTTEDPIQDAQGKVVDLSRISKDWNPARNAIDPVDSMMIATERYVRAAQQAQMRRKWWDSIKSRPKGDLDKIGKVVQFNRGRGGIRSLLTPRERSKITQMHVSKGRPDPFENLIEIPAKNDPKGRSFYFRPTKEFRNLKQALTHEPTASIPIMRGVKSLFSFGYVGAVRPLQAIPLALYDTTTPAAARARGQLFGLDWLADVAKKTATGSRLTDRQLQTIQNIPGSNILDSLIGTAVIVPRALQLYMKRNKTRIIQQTMQSVAAESGWMRHMLEIPAYNRWFQGVLDNSVDGFTDSFMKELTRSGAISTTELNRTRRSIIEYNKLMSDIPTKWETTLAPINETWTQYQMMFNSFRDSVRFHYAAVNAARLADRYGGDFSKVPKSKRERLVHDARRISGDQQERAGSKGLQYYTSATPFFNPMLAGAKNVWSRITHDPRVAYTFMTGIVVPQLFTTAYVSNWWDEEAKKWYWSKPAWERATSIMWIRPDIILRRSLGEEIPFDPDYVHQMFTEHTYRPLTTGIMTMFETMGMFGDSTLEGTTDPSGTFTNALAQAFTPLIPPAINFGLYMTTGAQVDLGARMTGRGNVLRMDSDPERAYRPIRENSAIPNHMLETAMLLAGNFGGDLIHALDSGLDNYSDQDELVDSVLNAGKEFSQRSTRTSVQPIPFATGPLANQHANNRYRTNALSKRGYELREVFTLTGGGLERGMVRKSVDIEEPTLATVANMLKQYQKSRTWKQYSERFRDLSDKLKRIDSAKKLDFNLRSKARQAVLEEFEQFQQEQNEWMVGIEEQLHRARGPQGQPLTEEYKALYGEDLNFTNLVDRLTRMRRQQQ